MKNILKFFIVFILIIVSVVETINVISTFADAKSAKAEVTYTIEHVNQRVSIESHPGESVIHQGGDLINGMLPTNTKTIGVCRITLLGESGENIALEVGATIRCGANYYTVIGH